MRVGLLGCGAIGSAVGAAIIEGRVAEAALSGIHTRTPERADAFLDRTDSTGVVPVVDEAGALAADADVVVEAANQAAIADYAVDTLSAGCDLVALSVGALRDVDLHQRVRASARANGARVFVPSGAVAGLDGVAALAKGSLEAVSLVGRRPPEMLGPYVDDVDALADEDSGTVLFEGTAAEAAGAFPAHMNIAVALALVAGLPPSDVAVELVLDHGAPRSIYTVEANGDGGTVSTTIENVATPTPGDATHLVVQSTVATLDRMAAPVVVGT